MNSNILCLYWTRFDHYATLCELLPAALPSLAYCLEALNQGKTFSYIQQEKVETRLDFHRFLGSGLLRCAGSSPDQRLVIAPTIGRVWQRYDHCFLPHVRGLLIAQQLLPHNFYVEMSPVSFNSRLMYLFIHFYLRLENFVMSLLRRVDSRRLVNLLIISIRFFLRIHGWRTKKIDSKETWSVRNLPSQCNEI